MLNITDIRELTDEEKEKYRLEKEIEAKKRELEDLNSKIESMKECNSKNSLEKTSEITEKSDNNNIFSLTKEEELIVSNAIKQDKDKDEQVSEEIRQIIEKSNKEYLEIEKEYNKIKPSKRTMILAISLAILMIFMRIIGMNMKNNANSISNIDTDNITVMTTNGNNSEENNNKQKDNNVDYIVNMGE